MMRVARILDGHSVVITGGKDANVKPGNLLCIAEQILDPETGEALGTYPNLNVVVTRVFPRFCVAETVPVHPPHPRTVVVNIGDEVVRP